MPGTATLGANALTGRFLTLRRASVGLPRLGGAEPGYGAVSHRLPKAVAGGRPSAPAVHAPEPPSAGVTASRPLTVWSKRVAQERPSGATFAL